MTNVKTDLWCRSTELTYRIIMKKKKTPPFVGVRCNTFDPIAFVAACCGTAVSTGTTDAFLTDLSGKLNKREKF